MKLESRFERRRGIGSAKGWSVRWEFAWAMYINIKKKAVSGQLHIWTQS